MSVVDDVRKLVEFRDNRGEWLRSGKISLNDFEAGYSSYIAALSDAGDEAGRIMAMNDSELCSMTYESLVQVRDYLAAWGQKWCKGKSKPADAAARLGAIISRYEKAMSAK